MADARFLTLLLPPVRLAWLNAVTGCAFSSQPGMSKIRPSTSRIWVRAAAPTLPRGSVRRPAATARTCWHRAEDLWSRPLDGSASISTSEAKARTVDVSGTTWTTEGEASSRRWAVTTTAGCRKPASRPIGEPKSTATTSPEFSIEPVDLWFGQLPTKLGTDLVLAQATDGERNRVSDARAEGGGQSLEFPVRRRVDPNAGALHAFTLAELHARRRAGGARAACVTWSSITSFSIVLQKWTFALLGLR